VEAAGGLDPDEYVAQAPVGADPQLLLLDLQGLDVGLLAVVHAQGAVIDILVHLDLGVNLGGVALPDDRALDAAGLAVLAGQRLQLGLGGARAAVTLPPRGQHVVLVGGLAAGKQQSQGEQGEDTGQRAGVETSHGRGPL